MKNEIEKALNRGWQLIRLNGKVPLDKAWQLGAATNDERVQNALAVRAHTGNVGLITGKPSGIIVIDIDTHSGATLKPDDFPVTVTSVTGKGGYHLFYQRPDIDFLGNATKGIFPKNSHVDIRGDGGQVVMVGSFHPETNKRYTWASGKSPDDLPFADFPQNVLDRMLQVQAPVQPIPKGDYVPWDASQGTHPWIGAMLKNVSGKLARCAAHRNSELNNAALILGHYCPEYLSIDEIEGALIPAMSANGYLATDGMYAVRATIASGLAAGMLDRQHPPAPSSKAVATATTTTPKAPKSPAVSVAVAAAKGHILQDGEPRTMAGHFMDSCDSRSLAFWMSSFWEYNAGAYQRVEDVAIDIKVRNGIEGCHIPVYNKALNVWEDKKIVLKNSVISEIFGAIKAIDGVYLNSNCMAPMWRDSRKDNPKEIFTARNGLFNFRTGNFAPHDSSFFSLGASDFDFDRDAKCPEWEDWLGQVFRKDKTQIKLLQEWMGYCLTYDCSQRKVMLLLGVTTSGKGTILNILSHLLGEKNMVSAEPGDTLDRFFGASIFGKRLINFFDLRMGGRLDAAAFGAAILKLAEGAPLKIEAKNKDPFTAPTVAKVTIASNNLPRFVDASSAVAGRFLVLRFTESFLGKEDKGLDERLEKELPGIFLWALAGLERLQDNKWRWTQHVAGQETLEEMADECSPVKRFVDECCIIDPLCEVERMTLFVEWKKYCEERNILQVGTDSSFGAALKDAYGQIQVGRPKEPVTRRCLPRTHIGLRLKYEYEK